MEIPLAERLRILTSKDSWFGRAPADFRNAVLAACEWRSYETGEIVYRVVDESGDLLGLRTEASSSSRASDRPRIL